MDIRRTEFGTNVAPSRGMARKTNRRTARQQAPDGQRPVVQLELPPPSIEDRSVRTAEETRAPRGVDWVDFYL